MKCRHCLEEIIDGAPVCRHCGKRQAKSQVGKVVLWTLGGVVALFAMMIWYGSTLREPDPGQDMKTACERQFGAGSEANACVIALAEKRMDEDRAEKLKAADRASR